MNSTMAINIEKVFICVCVKHEHCQSNLMCLYVCIYPN